MDYNVKIYKIVILMCVVGVVISVPIACTTTPVATYASAEEVAYSIVVTIRGEIQIRNAKGEQISPSQYPLPLPIGERGLKEKALPNLRNRNLGIASYIGSHYDVVTVDGVPYKIDLPPPHP
jgi:hypothetical protein